jgi:hypothetical protein
MLEEQPPTWATAAPVRRVSFQGSQRQDALERKQRMPRHHQSRAAWRERQMGASLAAESKPKSEESLMQIPPAGARTDLLGVGTPRRAAECA